MFFFQAEDGIRDIGVTGVQTCALPICQATTRIVIVARDRSQRAKPAAYVDGEERVEIASRSEERRVGKSVDLGGRRIIKKKTYTSSSSLTHSILTISHSLYCHSRDTLP